MSLSKATSAVLASEAKRLLTGDSARATDSTSVFQALQCGHLPNHFGLVGGEFNAVAPGLTRTPLTQGLVASELAEKASIGMHPLGRLGTPEDVARAILFLLDPAQDWITGQVLGVDGGLASLKTRQG